MYISLEARFSSPVGKGESKRGVAPLSFIFPFPAGEGDSGDRASIVKKGRRDKKEFPMCL
jgi:hypothetical protein